MRYNTLLLAAIGLECALAQPAHHRHQHKQRRDLANVNWQKVDYDMSSVNWSKVDYTGGKSPGESHGQPAAPPVANASPKVVDVVPVPVDHSNDQPAGDKPSDDKPPVDEPSNDKPSGDSAGSGIVSGATGGAQGNFGGRTTPVVTGHRITYIGNVGSPYGSNMMFIPNGDAKKYKYTLLFKNIGEKAMPINVWNKAGRDGQANSGGCTEPNLKFTLNGGESQTVAFDENTQGAFSRDCERGPGNYPACVWGEFDYGDLRPADPTGIANEGHSGFDRSSIPGGHHEVLTMSCVDCAGGEQTSSREKNRFVSDQQLSAGGDVEPGPAHFKVEMSW